MAQNMHAPEKGLVQVDHVESIQRDAALHRPTHYQPETDEERRLDKRVNLKLDFVVVLLLAVMFIVGHWLWWPNLVQTRLTVSCSFVASIKRT